MVEPGTATSPAQNAPPVKTGDVLGDLLIQKAERIAKESGTSGGSQAKPGTPADQARAAEAAQGQKKDDKQEAAAGAEATKTPEEIAAAEAEQAASEAAVGAEASSGADDKTKKAKEKPQFEATIASIYKEEEEAAEDSKQEAAAAAGDDKKDAGKKAPTLDESLKAAYYDELMADDFIRTLADIRRNGGDVREAVNALKEVDYSKMTPEELITTDCQANGLTDEKDIEAEIADYQNLSPLNKKKRLSEITSELSKQDADRKSKLGLRAAEERTNRDSAIRKFHEEVNSLIDSHIGKPFEFRKELSKKDADRLRKAAFSFTLMNKDGTFNSPKIVQMLYRSMYYADDVGSATNNGIAMGMEKVLEEVSRPDNGNAIRGNNNRQAKSKNDQLNEMISSGKS